MPRMPLLLKGCQSSADNVYKWLSSSPTGSLISFRKDTFSQCFSACFWACQHSYGKTNVHRLTPELMQECERVISKTLPACVAFHKPSFLQQLKSATLDTTMINALLTIAAR
jgi:hypothetical protein